jgi:hypothetical protein
MTVSQPYKPANHLDAPKSVTAVQGPSGAYIASLEEWADRLQGAGVHA